MRTASYWMNFLNVVDWFQKRNTWFLHLVTISCPLFEMSHELLKNRWITANYRHSLQEHEKLCEELLSFATEMAEDSQVY